MHWRRVELDVLVGHASDQARRSLEGGVAALADGEQPAAAFVEWGGAALALLSKADWRAATFAFDEGCQVFETLKFCDAHALVQ